METNKCSRELGYDILRIIACFMVIVNHTISTTVFLFLNGFSFTAFTGDFIFNACRMNVVSFIFISGALLLGKEESYKDWLVKRVLRVLLVILLFSTLYYDWSTGSFKGYLRLIFENNITNAYWFLYMYLGLMLTLPLLRKMCKSMQNCDYILVLVLFLITQSIYPLLAHYFNLPSFNLTFSYLYSYWIGWYGIFILGYFGGQLINKYKAKIIHLFPLFLGVWFIGNLIPTIITYREMYYKQSTELFMDNPFWIWSIIATVSIDCFLVAVLPSKVFVRKAHRYIEYISGLTFGIYLLSDKLIVVVFDLFKNWTINDCFKIMVLDILIFCIGAAITVCLKKIPLIRRII